MEITDLLKENKTLKKDLELANSILCKLKVTKAFGSITIGFGTTLNGGEDVTSANITKEQSEYIKKIKEDENEQSCGTFNEPNKMS